MKYKIPTKADIKNDVLQKTQKQKQSVTKPIL